MESFITVAIIILVVLYNLITNYMKEQQRNHERKRNNNKPIITENFPPIIPVFQTKEEKHTSESFDDYNYNESDDTSEDYSYNYTGYFPQSAYSENKEDGYLTDSQKVILNSSTSFATQSSYLESNLTSSYTSYLTQTDIGLSSKSEIEEQYAKDDFSNKSMDLELNSSDDYKRAFIYSLIFQRKY